MWKVETHILRRQNMSKMYTNLWKRVRIIVGVVAEAMRLTFTQILDALR